ncbi:DUF4124 domain-containing protein [Haliea sp.]
MMSRLLVSVLLSLACGAAADSTTVYRFVDSNGVVGFSDTPPPEGVSARALRIVAPESSAADTLQRLEAMRQTTDRMASDRREREAQRELVRLRAATAEAARQRPMPREQVRHEYIYLPVATVPPWRRGYYPPPHRPRDPSRLGIIPGPNSQLMRPILSRPRN